MAITKHEPSENARRVALVSNSLQTADCVPPAASAPPAPPPPPPDKSHVPYDPLKTYAPCSDNSVYTQCISWPAAFLQQSASRKRKMHELENEYAHAANATTERERLTIIGSTIVSRWIATRNKLARAVVISALYNPAVLQEVTGFESKLYTALTNVVWVDDRDRSMCSLSRHEASELVAFVSSMIGPTKQKRAHHGPIHKAATGEGIDQEDENSMHRLLRELGYTKLEIPTNSADAACFWKSLYGKYGSESMKGAKRHRVRASIDDFWMKAVDAWVGPLEAHG